jgi:threonyl-tRNA synthetase
MLVVGGREADEGRVAVRHRKRGDLGPVALDQFLETIAAEIASKAGE